MIHSYFQLVFRHFLKEKSHATIIVIGLAIGIASALIIAQYIHFELSFDKNVSDREDIYYTYMEWTQADNVVDGKCFPALAPLAKARLPEVKSYARMIPPMGESEVMIIREKDGRMLKYSDVKDTYLVDPSFFDFFSIPLLEGDPKTALERPHSVVITKSVAEKFFPNEDPLNKVLVAALPGGLKDESVITGVVADPSNSSSIQFKVLLTTASMPWDFDHTWMLPEFATFMKLQPGADYKTVALKLNSAAEPIRELEKKLNTKLTIHLFPFKDFHFFRHHNTHTVGQIQFTGDRRLLNYFAILGVLIILISWANYINLTTAKAIGRSKEIGLRKVSGASRNNLIAQFFIEFFLINSISTLLALTFAQLSFEVFARIIGSKAEWILWTNPVFWVVMVAWVMFSTIISGLYPALVISDYKPIKVLKGNFATSQRGASVRKALVIFQFGLSVFMIMSIYVISRQLHFMQQKDLGMSVDQVVVIPNTQLAGVSGKRNALDQLRMKLEGNDRIKSISSAAEFPGKVTPRSMVFRRTLDNDKQPMGLETNTVSENYFVTMGIRMLVGRDFVSNQPSDSMKTIITEQAAIDLGFKDANSAVGEKITSGDTGNEYEVIGVVSNFYLNLKQSTRGEIFFTEDIFSIEKDAAFKILLIKLSSTDVKQSMSIIGNQWNKLFANTPFDFFFLDNYFDTFYNEEKQFAGVFGFFSAIGIIVTCMGLFGLSLYDTSSRNKEIGIRKSLGASVSAIMWMFSKGYLRLVFIAAVMGVPAGYLLLSQWLSNYPQRIALQVDALLFPALLMCMICVLTVGYHTFKTARVNPVESLRND